MAAWTKMPLGLEVGLHPVDFVFDGELAAPRRKGSSTPTQFLAHVYCGLMAGWMKMQLGMEVNVGSGDVVLDGVTPGGRGLFPF